MGIARGAVHNVHAGYTLLAPLRSDPGEVSRLLSEMQREPSRLPFADVPSVHFATCAVIPAQEWEGEELPATLLFATSFSGPARAHVAELVAKMGPQLHTLFRHCQGFSLYATDEDLAQFIRDHRRPDAFYSGMHHLTREDVLRHRELRLAIQEFIDTRQRAGGLTGDPKEVRREIQEYVAAQPDLAWAKQPWQPPRSAFWARQWPGVLLLAFAGLLLAGTAVFPFVDVPALAFAVKAAWLGLFGLIVVLGALLVGVRKAEDEQRYVAGRPPDERARELAATQTKKVINEMTIAGPIKNGRARPLFLRALLWLVRRLAEGIPGVRPPLHIPTVATARWIAMDGGRRLVFISNFTNDAEPYVRDFIDTHDGAKRINISFGFGGGYPKTEWIYKRGADEDPNAFIWVVAANQRPTELWFCPYHDMTIDNIVINRKIREGLFATEEEKGAREWLALL